MVKREKQYIVSVKINLLKDNVGRRRFAIYLVGTSIVRILRFPNSLPSRGMRGREIEESKCNLILEWSK